MNEQLLSKRLERVGFHVPMGSRLADIGSDHAYLPVALILQDKISFAVAGEVVKGPFNSACKQVAKNNLTERIVVRLADGLAAVHLEDAIDCVTIAGMGGTLIASILEAGLKNRSITGQERLILQPNVGEKNVRQWLMANQYEILTEEILEENGKIYEIIVAHPTAKEQIYSEQELCFGPFLAKEKDPVFIKKWQQELQQYENVLAQLEKASHSPVAKIKQIHSDMQQIKELLK